MIAQDKEQVKDNAVRRLEQDVLPFMAQNIASIIRKANLYKLGQLEELRLRAGMPLTVHNYRGDWFVEADGNLSGQPENSYCVTQIDILRTLEIMSENSIYAYQEEIRNGYLTLKGGHRVGIAGRVVYDGNTIRNIRDVSSLSIRLSNQVIGCSSKVIRYILRGNDDVHNTLIISPPQCGKTTMLRDIARIISDGDATLAFNGIKVGIVDERSEIAACCKGIPQNRVGLRTDVLDGCPKRLGMAMMIRSMSPKVLVTDEIGNEGDREAVLTVMNAGVRIVTSAHGYNISELKSRREVLRLMEERVFDRYIVLGCSKGPGTLVEVVDGRTMKLLAGAD